MVLFYVMKIKDGTITIEDVPTRWKENVEAQLNKE
ncbi:MAG: CD1375 family protein [Lachnospiraceae bacterium]|nr:CD1375 family protein [Lachnospiraceae bacterium]